MKQMVKSWKTCDLKTAAFLLYAGFPVARMSQEGQRAVFEFDDTVERQNAVLNFWNKKQKVEPVSFMDSLNRARDMVTQALRA